jgi:sterol desaturase/sphingolipid hydroxylase (fatty acid hydroxylase superfamily)
MPHPAFASEPVIRLGAFLGVLAAMALWEALAPLRPQPILRWRRWPNNLGMGILDAFVLRVVFPTAAVGAAVFAQARGWGLFNIVPVVDWAALVATVLLLDLIIYGQHVAFHAVPLLWRLHRVHHADLEVDVTTGLRFHPIEIALSMGIKMAAVVLLGARPLGVLIFEVLLNGTTMFNHGNVRLPQRLDSALRWLVITPRMHRIHHSILRRETDSNFGFNLPWWDRLFGTYRVQPEAGYDRMAIGIDRFRDPAESRIDRLLLQPFRNDGPQSRSRDANARIS